MWRPRDRERFIGSYDPEHEMPDPDRDPGDRWQSDAYRRGARDTRYGYRWNPDAIENRYEGSRRDIDAEREARWRGDARVATTAAAAMAAPAVGMVVDTAAVTAVAMKVAATAAAGTATPIATLRTIASAAGTTAAMTVDSTAAGTVTSTATASTTAAAS